MILVGNRVKQLSKRIHTIVSGRSDGMEQGIETKKTHNKELGAKGEQAAASYLEHVGYEVIERNWRCPAGEADIVALDEDELVFCEVKTRTSLKRGFPSESVDEKKRARYEKIAAWYLKAFDVGTRPVRFDVIAVLVVNDDRAMIRHYKNAFGQGF